MGDGTKKGSTSSTYHAVGAVTLAALGIYTPLEDHTEGLYCVNYKGQGTYSRATMTESTVTREEIDAKIAASTAELQGSINTLNVLTQGINTRLTTVEQDLRTLIDKVDRNFIITWGGIIFGVLGLASMMATGFGWLSIATPPTP